LSSRITELEQFISEETKGFRWSRHHC